MTAINLATDIPNQIVTVEQLVIWAISILNKNNSTLQILEQANALPELAAQLLRFDAADQSLRVVGRVSLPVNPAILDDNSKKAWMWTTELSTVAIAAGFKTN